MGLKANVQKRRVRVGLGGRGCSVRAARQAWLLCGRLELQPLPEETSLRLMRKKRATFIKEVSAHRGISEAACASAHPQTSSPRASAVAWRPSSWTRPCPGAPGVSRVMVPQRLGKQAGQVGRPHREAVSGWVSWGRGVNPLRWGQVGKGSVAR